MTAAAERETLMAKVILSLYYTARYARLAVT
jgi:hypothetical protein